MIDHIRSLRGQVMATGLLFVCSLPIAVGVMIARPYFEKYHQETYTSNNQPLDPHLNSLIESLEDDTREGMRLTESETERRDQELKMISIEMRRRIYETWIQGRRSAGPKTTRRLSMLFPTEFLQWAELSVVCGNAAQREAAFKFMQRSESPAIPEILCRLSIWAKRNHRSEISAEIEHFRSL